MGHTGLSPAQGDPAQRHRLHQKDGVTIKTGIHFGSDVKISDLRKNGANAVIVATGTQKSLKMNIENEDHHRGYLDCLDFLKACSDGQDVAPGEAGMVIGGGNAAWTRPALPFERAVTKVTILYRRALRRCLRLEKRSMRPCGGVQIEFLTARRRCWFQEAGSRVLKCLRTELREADQSGRKGLCR